MELILIIVAADTGAGSAATGENQDRLSEP
jgi:hypothetical protein